MSFLDFWNFRFWFRWTASLYLDHLEVLFVFVFWSSCRFWFARSWIPGLLDILVVLTLFPLWILEGSISPTLSPIPNMLLLGHVHPWCCPLYFKSLRFSSPSLHPLPHLNFLADFFICITNFLTQLIDLFLSTLLTLLSKYWVELSACLGLISERSLIIFTSKFWNLHLKFAYLSISFSSAIVEFWPFAGIIIVLLLHFLFVFLCYNLCICWFRYLFWVY